MRKPSVVRAASSDDVPEFFKVFLPSYSSHQLELPPAFVDHFKGKPPSKVILKDQRGKSWHVETKERDDEYFFVNGWKAFVDDHILEYGDFLIFGYLRNCIFSVKIFGKNGGVKTFMETTIKDDADQIETRTTVPVVTIKDESNFDQTETNTTSSSSQNLLEVVLRRQRGRPERGAATFNRYPSKSKVTKYEYPFYEFTVTRWYLYNVHIPIRIFDAHNIRMGPKLVVEDQSGKQWPVKFYARDRRITLGAGWSECRASNNIKEDDKCGLELVVDRSNICRKINVRIISKHKSAIRSNHKSATRSRSSYKYALRSR